MDKAFQYWPEFMPRDKYYGLYQASREIVFSDDDRPNRILNLEDYANNKRNPVPIVTLQGSDYPGFVLRPECDDSWQHAIEVYNKPVLVKPDRYVVYPLMPQYVERYFQGQPFDDEFRWHSGIDMLTHEQNWIKPRIKIGIGYPEQLYSPIHFNLLKDITTTIDDRYVMLPPVVLPYSLHRHNMGQNYRRNLKITQQNIATVGARVILFTYNETDGGVLIDTKPVALNIGRYIEEWFGDGHFLHLVLDVPAGSAVFKNMQMFIG